MELALIAALAFLAGSLTATLAATWWARHRHDELRRELAVQQDRMRTLECLLLYRGAPVGLPAPAPARW
jgi:hypothetical protein